MDEFQKKFENVFHTNSIDYSLTKLSGYYRSSFRTKRFEIVDWLEYFVVENKKLSNTKLLYYAGVNINIDASSNDLKIKCLKKWIKERKKNLAKPLKYSSKVNIIELISHDLNYIYKLLNEQVLTGKFTKYIIGSNRIFLDYESLASYLLEADPKNPLLVNSLHESLILIDKIFNLHNNEIFELEKINNDGDVLNFIDWGEDGFTQLSSHYKCLRIIDKVVSIVYLNTQQNRINFSNDYNFVIYDSDNFAHRSNSLMARITSFLNINSQEKLNNVILAKNNLAMSDVSKVFVTYSWDNKEHEQRVIEFTNYLLKKGYDANVDKKMIQEQTAIHLTEMMSRIMTDYQKVIIVLSKGYKEKADAFKGGVSMEYKIILNLIDKEPNKFVLVSFEGIDDSITPVALMGREIVNLTKGEEAFEKLHSKLQDKPLITFSERNPVLHEVIAKEIGEFKLEQKTIDFDKINEDAFSTALLGGMLQKVERTVSFSFTNVSGKTIEGCNIEVQVPPQLLFDREDKPTGLETQISNKIYPNQKFKSHDVNIRITQQNYKIAKEAKVVINVYSDLGKNEYLIDVLDCVHVHKYGQDVKLEDKDFHN